MKGEGLWRRFGCEIGLGMNESEASVSFIGIERIEAPASGWTGLVLWRRILPPSDRIGVSGLFARVYRYYIL